MEKCRCHPVKVLLAIYSDTGLTLEQFWATILYVWSRLALLTVFPHPSWQCLVQTLFSSYGITHPVIATFHSLSANRSHQGQRRTSWNVPEQKTCFLQLNRVQSSSIIKGHFLSVVVCEQDAQLQTKHLPSFTFFAYRARKEQVAPVNSFKSAFEIRLAAICCLALVPVLLLGDSCLNYISGVVATTLARKSSIN